MTTLTPANGPEGEQVAITLYGIAAPVSGELLAVDSTRIAVLQDPNIRELSWTVIHKVRLMTYGKTIYATRTPPDSAEMVLLRALSWFPQGMDSTLAVRIKAARREALRLP